MFGRPSGGCNLKFISTFPSKWAVEWKLISGESIGLGTKTWEGFSPNFTFWAHKEMPQSHGCGALMVGIWSLEEHLMIGKWQRLPGFFKCWIISQVLPPKQTNSLHNKGVFTVKSCYWERKNNQVNTEVWSWKLIWKVKKPIKISWFTWLVVRKACLTHEVLQRKMFPVLLKTFYVQSRSRSEQQTTIYSSLQSS